MNILGLVGICKVMGIKLQIGVHSVIIPKRGSKKWVYDKFHTLTHSPDFMNPLRGFPLFFLAILLQFCNRYEVDLLNFNHLLSFVIRVLSIERNSIIK